MTRPKDVKWSPQEWEAFWKLGDDWLGLTARYGGHTPYLTKQSLRSILSRLEKEIYSSLSSSLSWESDADEGGSLSYAEDIATIRHLRKRL